jgi:hypothetical protein
MCEPVLDGGALAKLGERFAGGLEFAQMDEERLLMVERPLSRPTVRRDRAFRPGPLFFGGRSPEL